MTTHAERTVVVDAPIESVWRFIADPAAKANAISVVDSWDEHDPSGRHMTWHIRLPIPFVSSTVPVETRDLERDEPRYVKFEGRSPAMRVVGEHTLESMEDGGTRLTNRFTVTSPVPGVERFFTRNLDRELTNIEAALSRAVEA